MTKRTYVYRTRSGDDYLRVVRVDAGGRKRIWQERPDGDGGWTKGGQTGPHPIYRLPEIARTHHDQRIAIVEGEKCVHALLKESGQPVTTWLGGTAQVLATDWSPLAQRKIIVVPDDDQPGIEAASQLCDKLQEIGCTDIRIVSCDGTGGDDVADWITNGTVNQRFNDYRTVGTDDPKTNNLTTTDSWWETLLPEGDYPPEPPALLERDDGRGLIPAKGFIEIIGPRGSGKSWIAILVAAAAIKAGRRVVYFRSESTRRAMQERLRVAGAVKPEVLLDTDRFRSVPRAKLDAFLANHDGWCDGGVVIIDTASAAGGSINDGAEAEEWLNRTVHTFTGRDESTLVISVDHTAKRLPEDILTIDSRHSSVKSAAADMVLFVDGYTGKGKNLQKTCWTRDRDGFVLLREAKPHRDGYYGSESDHNVLAKITGYHDMGRGIDDDGNGYLTISCGPPDDDTEPAEDPVHAAMVEGLRVLRTGSHHSTDLKDAIRQRGHAKNPTETAVSRMVRDGWASTQRDGRRTRYDLTFEGIDYISTYDDEP
ncbi:MAG: AAA family ATPase [Gemmatimonadetes bacterium]|nr:AAA family ATPase [Gemmatimonadota bacterium]